MNFSDKLYKLIVAVLHGGVMKRCLLFILITSSFVLAETVRIGAYDNPPKIFIDDNGQVRGFWADVTNEIAEKEGWDIEWVEGSWDECLVRLDDGEIDVMVDTGLTPEREKEYIFSEETVHLSWTRIYKDPESDIETILDLEGKIIAGLKNSFDLEGPEGLRKKLKDFDIDAQIIELNSYDEILSAIEENKTDAGIVDKDYGNLNEQNFKVACTPIVLQPAKMLYAFNKESERSPVLANSIDRRLNELKSDHGSVYYRSFDNFFNGQAKAFQIPVWLRVTLVIIIVLLIIFIILNKLLKSEVSLKSASLKKSEENFRITLESIGDGVIATDSKGMITMMNRTAEQLTGYTAEEAEGLEIRHVFLIINAHSREEVLNPVEIVMKDGRTVGLGNHTVLISKEGKEYQIADSAAPIEDENGNIHGMILVFSDITEKYIYQEKIAENERFLNSLISNLKGVVYRCRNDEGWTMMYLNKEFSELTGYDPQEFTGSGEKKYNEIIFDDDKEKVKNEVEKAVAAKDHFSIEYRIIDSSGGIKWVLEKGKGVFDENGELRFLEGFITEITLSKTAEIRIREKSDELERSNRLMIDREIKMVELKKEINLLLKELGKDAKYNVNE